MADLVLPGDRHFIPTSFSAVVQSGMLEEMMRVSTRLVDDGTLLQLLYVALADDRVLKAMNPRPHPNGQAVFDVVRADRRRLKLLVRRPSAVRNSLESRHNHVFDPWTIQLAGRNWEVNSRVVALVSTGDPDKERDDENRNRGENIEAADARLRQVLEHNLPDCRGVEFVSPEKAGEFGQVLPLYLGRPGGTTEDYDPTYGQIVVEYTGAYLMSAGGLWVHEDYLHQVLSVDDSVAVSLFGQFGYKYESLERTLDNPWGALIAPTNVDRMPAGLDPYSPEQARSILQEGVLAIELQRSVTPESSYTAALDHLKERFGAEHPVIGRARRVGPRIQLTSLAARQTLPGGSPLLEIAARNATAATDPRVRNVVNGVICLDGRILVGRRLDGMHAGVGSTITAAVPELPLSMIPGYDPALSDQWFDYSEDDARTVRLDDSNTNVTVKLAREVLAKVVPRADMLKLDGTARIAGIREELVPEIDPETGEPDWDAAIPHRMVCVEIVLEEKPKTILGDELSPIGFISIDALRRRVAGEIPAVVIDRAYFSNAFAGLCIDTALKTLDVAGRLPDIEPLPYWQSPTDDMLDVDIAVVSLIETALYYDDRCNEEGRELDCYVVEKVGDNGLFAGDRSLIAERMKNHLIRLARLPRDEWGAQLEGMRHDFISRKAETDGRMQLNSDFYEAVERGMARLKVWPPLLRLEESGWLAGVVHFSTPDWALSFCALRGEFDAPYETLPGATLPDSSFVPSSNPLPGDLPDEHIALALALYVREVLVRTWSTRLVSEHTVKMARRMSENDKLARSIDPNNPVHKAASDMNELLGRLWLDTSVSVLSESARAMPELRGKITMTHVRKVQRKLDRQIVELFRETNLDVSELNRSLRPAFAVLGMEPGVNRKVHSLQSLPDNNAVFRLLSEYGMCEWVNSDALANIVLYRSPDVVAHALRSERGVGSPIRHQGPSLQAIPPRAST